MKLSDDFAWFAAVGGTDDAHAFEGVDDTSGPRIPELEATLKHGGGSFPLTLHEPYRFFDNLWVFIEVSRSITHTSPEVPTISLDDRGIVDIFEHGWIDGPFDMIHNGFDFFGTHVDPLDTFRSR